MNTRSLAQHYDALTPWERVPLILAATGRGDYLEEERLRRSAPKLSYLIPDHYCLGDKLFRLADFYVMRQLELAAHYWQTRAHLENRSARRSPKRAGAPLDKALNVLIYRCVVLADAWSSICADLHIDPEILVRDHPCYATVRHMERLARFTPCSMAEAVASVRELERFQEAATREALAEVDAAPLASVAGEVRWMREFLEKEDIDENPVNWLEYILNLPRE